MLPEPLDREITLAYLVFRIADTIEDADHLGRDERCESLSEFQHLLQELLTGNVDHGSAEDWSKRYGNVSQNEDYNRLVRDTGRVLRLVAELRATAKTTIHSHAARSVRGMRETLRRADVEGNLTLCSVDDLRQYCYYVAGIVGEMITGLFLADHDKATDESHELALQDTAASFGEALQLVNILKDSGDDAICGRSYLPPNVPRDQIHHLAMDRLRDAEVYVQTLRDIFAAPGVVAFCDAPLQLAKRTLQVVAEQGPGSKIPREETFAILQEVMRRSGLDT